MRHPDAPRFRPAGRGIWLGRVRTHMRSFAPPEKQLRSG